jgi:8-oxo-dGDP phosphatase
VAYEVEGSERTYDGALSRVRVDRVRMPDGEVAEREVVEHPSAVAVVPVDDVGRVVLLRHYRHPVRATLLELPAGKLDVEGEDPAEAAERELAEETGLRAPALEHLVTFSNSSGWTDEQTTIYLARGVEDGERPEGFVATGEEADIEVVRLPLDEVAGAARRGEIPDAKTLIGVLLAADRLAATSG